jgi:hypothetical protein
MAPRRLTASREPVAAIASGSVGLDASKELSCRSSWPPFLRARLPRQRGLHALGRLRECIGRSPTRGSVVDFAMRADGMRQELAAARSGLARRRRAGPAGGRPRWTASARDTPLRLEAGRAVTPLNRRRGARQDAWALSRPHLEMARQRTDRKAKQGRLSNSLRGVYPSTSRSVSDGRAWLEEACDEDNRTSRHTSLCRAVVELALTPRCDGAGQRRLRRRRGTEVPHIRLCGGRLRRRPGRRTLSSGCGHVRRLGRLLRMRLAGRRGGRPKRAGYACATPLVAGSTDFRTRARGRLCFAPSYDSRAKR